MPPSVQSTTQKVDRNVSCLLGVPASHTHTSKPVINNSETGPALCVFCMLFDNLIIVEAMYTAQYGTLCAKITIHRKEGRVLEGS